MRCLCKQGHNGNRHVCEAPKHGCTAGHGKDARVGKASPSFGKGLADHSATERADHHGWDKGAHGYCQAWHADGQGEIRDERNGDRPNFKVLQPPREQMLHGAFGARQQNCRHFVVFTVRASVLSPGECRGKPAPGSILRKVAPCVVVGVAASDCWKAAVDESNDHDAKKDLCNLCPGLSLVQALCHPATELPHLFKDASHQCC
mmetsp:Transcript_86018/g.170760  ORF Transcript_86018/g.170760 Transcript_86018/m.170760 type:complete len:204 (+) Transcript_86018:41-652(+)